MACLYGTEKKFPTDSTIVVDPYQGANPVLVTIMRLALIPQPFEFSADEICSTEPPEYLEIVVADLISVVVLYAKVEQNARREAWFKGCQCKPAPPTPPIPPPPEPRPGAAPLPNFKEECDPILDYNHWRLEYRTYGDPALQTSYLRVQIYPYSSFPELSITRSQTNQNKIDVLNWGVKFDEFPRSNTDYMAVDWRLRFCQAEPTPPPPEEGDKPVLPNPCGDSLTCRFDDTSLLKQPDKAEIISELKLWVSESNDRIRDDILQNTSNAIESARENLWDGIEQTRTLINQKYQELDQRIDRSDADTESLVNGARQDIIDNTDGAKNQILLAIAASTSAIGAGIVAATTTVTAAITTATTTITTSVTAATNTITSAINSAKSSIEGTVKSEVEKYAPKYRKLTLTFIEVPRGVNFTYGLRNAPDKYALGWVQFYRQGSGNTRYYYDRQFVINLSQEFICQEPNIDAGYVLHILPNYQVSATLDWSAKKE